MFETYFNFKLFDFLYIGPPIVLQGNPRVLFQFLLILVSFSSEDWETEHGKFVNCKMFMTGSVGCTYKKYSWFLTL